MIKLHARRSESVFGSPTRSLALLVCSRAAEAALGVLGPVGSARCAQTQVSAVRIESSVDPLQLDPKMFSAPADAAVGFSQLPGTLRPSMRALGGIGTVQASLHALSSR